MRYSYTNPRKKSPLTDEFKFILVFFGVAFFMLFATYGYLKFKQYNFLNDMNEIDTTRTKLKKELSSMQDRIKFIKKESILAKRIYTQNDVLKDSISNLFDLVPQRITLSEAKLLKNGLVLKGVTPNKDIYNFLLHAPLRSIFTQTYTSFYPLENGWLSFVSTNYTDQEEQSDAIDDEINKKEAKQ